MKKSIVEYLNSLFEVKDFGYNYITNVGVIGAETYIDFNTHTAIFELTYKKQVILTIKSTYNGREQMNINNSTLMESFEFECLRNLVFSQPTGGSIIDDSGRLIKTIADVIIEIKNSKVVIT